MNNFIITIGALGVYDNEGAHDAAKLIMRKNEALSVKFFTGTIDKYPSCMVRIQNYGWVQIPIVSEWA